MFPYQTRLAAFAKAPQHRFVSRASRTITTDIAAKYKKELTPEFIAKYERTFDEYLKLVGAMHAAGVRLLAGSDFATSVTYPGFDLHEELHLLVRAGLPARDALAVATSSPARHLNQPDRGRVAVGKRADLVLLDRNPLDDIRHARAIHAVVSDGAYLTRAYLDTLLAAAEREAPGE